MPDENASTVRSFNVWGQSYMISLLALTGCATYTWNLSRPTCLPVIFKLAIEMAAA
jgi:hypothetical protein